MATGTAGVVSQLYHTNQVHYQDVRITFADDDKVINIGPKLPPGACVTDIMVQVDTAFSANSVLDVGTAADPDAYASAIVMTTAGLIKDVSTNPLVSHDDRSTSAVQLVASLTSSGTISAGVAYVIVAYVILGRVAPR